MSLRNLLKYSAVAALAAAVSVFSFLCFIAIDPRANTSVFCVYRGAETTDRKPTVSYHCSDKRRSTEQWQEDLRIIRKYVVYDGSFACIIFTDALIEYKSEESEFNREAFLKEVHLYSNILSLASQTAEMASDFKPEVGLKAKLWAMQFRLAHYVIAGPLTWTFPADNRSLDLWEQFYIATIRMPATAFANMCETFETYRGACTDPEVMPTAYIQQYVNNGPSNDNCIINLTYQ